MLDYKVLVDSSIWIQYFKAGGLDQLDRLIVEDLVCINDIILTELVPVLRQQRKNVVIDSLMALEKIPVTVNWEIIQEYQFMNLQHGINKVGIPDLIIVQQVLHERIALFSLDKHFRLMNSFLQFELIES